MVIGPQTEHTIGLFFLFSGKKFDEKTECILMILLPLYVTEIIELEKYGLFQTFQSTFE